MSEHDADHAQAVRELAAAHGVAVDYWDWQGRHVVVGTATLLGVLAALDVDASTVDRARAGLVDRETQEWRRMLPPALVTRQGRRTTFEVHVPDGWPLATGVGAAGDMLAADLDNDGQLEVVAPDRFNRMYAYTVPASTNVGA